MEAKARQLQQTDCGSLLIARSRCPYVAGCLLPTHVLRRNWLLRTHLEAKITLQKGQVALELYGYWEEEEEGTVHHLPFVVTYAEHRDFLLALSEASALYLLTGSEHPVAMSEGGERTLFQRVYDGGMAVEVSEMVRGQVLMLLKAAEAMPMAEEKKHSVVGT
jgi:hypothetical protein